MDSAKTLKPKLGTLPDARGALFVVWGHVHARRATLAGPLVHLVPCARRDCARPGSQDDSESRVQQGLSISPVPLDLHGKNRALVGIGSYLVQCARRLRCLPHRRRAAFPPRRESLLGQPEQIDPPVTSLEAGNSGRPALGQEAAT